MGSLGGPQAPMPLLPGDRETGLAVRGSGHTPNACHPDSQPSPSAFIASGLSSPTFENPGEATDIIRKIHRVHTHTSHIFTHTPHTHTSLTHTHSHSETHTHADSAGAEQPGPLRRREERRVHSAERGRRSGQAPQRPSRPGLTQPGPGPTSCGEGLLTSAGPGSHMPGAQRVFVGGPRTGSGGPGSVPCPLPHQDPVPWVRTLLPCHPDPPVVGTALPSLDLRRTALEQTAPGWGSGPGPPRPPGPLRRRQPLPREEPQELVPIRKASLGTGAPGTHRA